MKTKTNLSTDTTNKILQQIVKTSILISIVISFIFTNNICFSQENTKQIESRFKGKEIDFRKFLAQNIRYPGTSLNHKIYGLSISGITISPIGEIEKIESITSLDEDTDKEIIRLLSLTKNKWKKADTLSLSETFYIQIEFQIDSTYYPEIKHPYFVKPISIRATNIEIKNNDYFLRKFIEDKDKGKLDNALLCLNELIRRNPLNPKFYQLRMNLYRKTDQMELMSADLKKITEFIPGVSLDALLNSR